MTPERWGRIKEIFQAAIERPLEERSDYLDEACDGDDSLRSEVERLLEQEDAPSLASPAAGMLHQASADLSAGDMLAQYRVEGKLGEGNMGTAYLAYDTRLHRQVALKVLLPDRFAGPEQKLRLLREARAASALNHPNIVTVHEIGSGNGIDFIAMEYVEGRPLMHVIPSKGLSVVRAVEYAVQIADALAHAHRAGVVHGDLKPGNIMVTKAGQVKLLDFGLARRVHLPEGRTGTLSVQGVIAGTPAYMSPEQAEGRKIDERTDIFAFGAVLYELLSGSQAFRGDSTLAVLGAVLREELRPLAGVPRDLVRIVELCLRKDPARRMQSIVDVKIELEEASVAAPVPAAPKRRSWWGGAAALVVVAVAVVLSGLWLNRRPPPESATAMVQLTGDSGLTWQPSISADGKFIAYSSDRGGKANLDIWVQQITGGNPIQVTDDPADETEPAFSPDGSQVAFRSERDGGGVYVAPAFGGTARLIAPRGRSPQFSPDGSQIAYMRGTSLTNLPGGLWVVASSGETPRQIRPTGVSLSGRPIWSPDGKHLLCRGYSASEELYDWWVVPATGGAAIRAGVRDTLLRQNLWWQRVAAGAWVGDRLVFSIEQPDVPDLWQLHISPRTRHVSGEPGRLTFGTGMFAHPSISLTGQMVFTNLTVNRNVWSLEVDADRGRITGGPQRLTSEFRSHLSPVVSPDGTNVAFVQAQLRSGSQLRVRSITTGREATFSGIPASTLVDYPNFTPDGAKVIFRIIEDSRYSIYIVPAAGGVAEKICEDCGNAPGWSWDETKLVFDAVAGTRYVGLFDIKRGAKMAILSRSHRNLVHPRLCPGDRWICFAYIHGNSSSSIMIAPFRGAEAIPESEWIEVTDGSSYDSRPGWSPDGNLIYFISTRDGYRCIWAQRLEAATKRPVGPAFAVQHFHDPKRLIADIPYLGLSIARDKLVFNTIEQTGNIWTFKLPQEN